MLKGRFWRWGLALLILINLALMWRAFSALGDSPDALRAGTAYLASTLEQSA